MDGIKDDYLRLQIKTDAVLDSTSSQEFIDMIQDGNIMYESK